MPTEEMTTATNVIEASASPSRSTDGGGAAPARGGSSERDHVRCVPSPIGAGGAATVPGAGTWCGAARRGMARATSAGAGGAAEATLDGVAATPKGGVAMATMATAPVATGAGGGGA